MRRNGASRALKSGETLALWRIELREMAQLATPIVLTQFAWVSMLITDTAMIGRLGADALAGASLSLMVFFLAYVAYIGVVTATAALAAQAYGARKPRTLRRVIRQGLWVAIALTAPTLILFDYTVELLAALGQPPESLGYADAYMSTLKWCLPSVIGFAVLRNFVSALNRPAVALWVMMAGVPINAFLDYALIFGNFGFPRLELVGAGIATSAVNAALFLVLLAIAAIHKPFARYAILRRFWRSDWYQFRRIFQIGLPIAGTMLLEAGFFISAVFVAGHFGTVVVAAHMIAIQLPHVTFMVPMGMAQAATVRVGQAAGRGDAAAAYRAGWMAIALTLAFMCVMTVVVLAIPSAFASIFLDHARADSAAVLALATSFLLYAAFFQAVDGIQAVAAGALRGLNDTAIPMVFAAMCYWGVGGLSGLWFAFAGDMEGAGLWLGFIFGLGSAALLLAMRFRTMTRRRYLPVLSSGQK
ncbi:MAG: MATE family efflux transporter [Alphaproteobacteria bacterium]|nr:MATE family efflux transporter [Alphaproteobacteria bacterium]